MNIPMQISLVSEKTEQAIKFFFSKSYSIIPISLLIILIISGCAKEPTSPTIDKTVLVPLKVGNNWTYKNTKYDPKGFEGESEQYTIILTSDSIFNGEAIYKPGLLSFPENQEGKFWLLRNDGFYFLFLNDNDPQPKMIAKFPTFKGDSFGPDSDSTKVEQTDFDYTVPAGTFKCIKYVNESFGDNEIQSRTIMYYAPGIGNIAIESYVRHNHDYLWLEHKIVLLSYELK